MKLFFYLLTLLFLNSHLVFLTANEVKEQKLLNENEMIAEDSNSIVSLYHLDEGEEWRDVTHEVLNSSKTSQDAKDSIIKYRRRIIIFSYLSEGLKIKGFLSYTPDPKMHPLLILFRWGNQNFALMNPGLDLANYGDYTVISSTLRGGVSEGVDEFGGADVNDMKSLMDYIPVLTRELKIEINPHCTFMIGPSRGGLEMFLTLSRYPELQNRVTKVVALSAILDLHEQINDRSVDMKPMFEQEFGLNDSNKEKWIAHRDPINSISLIKKTLPILIIQGDQDPRIDLKEGYHMRDALKKSGHHVTYWEIPNGNHTLANIPNAMGMISTWLEKNANCREVAQKEKI